MTLTETQARALTLVKTGSYSYDRRSGSVRHRAHRPGTPIVNARTWAALAARGLVEYDDLTWGLAKITEAGRLALAQHTRRTEMPKSIARVLRDRLPEIPVHTAVEGRGPWLSGINVSRFTSEDIPSTTYPYTGTMVRVMYAPEEESEALHPAWTAAVREVLVAEYPTRLRTNFHLHPGMLIEDEDTAYSRQRAEEYAKRARLGWAPLHEIEVPW